MRVNHTATDTKHNSETHTQKTWKNNIPSRQDRTFFSFTQEACTLPFLAAQHVIHTCTPLKGLHAVQLIALWKFPLLQVCKIGQENTEKHTTD